MGVAELLANGLMDRSNPFVDAVYRSASDEAARNEAAAMLYAAENRHGVALSYGPAQIIEHRYPDSDAWESRCLKPFLAETNFLVSGFGQQRLELYDSEGYSRGDFITAWGHTMAAWANSNVALRRNWIGRSRPWEYYEFRSDEGIDDKNYPKWRDALFDVIARKTEIYGWTFQPLFLTFDANELKQWLSWGHNVQLVNGVLHPGLPRAEDCSAAAADRLAELIKQHVGSSNAGRCYGPGTHFVREGETDTILSPRIGFVSRHRQPLKSRVGWIQQMPDLVCEIRQIADINRRLDAKIDWWFGMGVSAVWVVDGTETRLEIHRAGMPVAFCSSGDTVSEQPELPGLAAAVDALFS
jgi:Uma2 family endonuclease